MDTKSFLLLNKVVILLLFSTVVYYQTEGAAAYKTEDNDDTNKSMQGSKELIEMIDHELESEEQGKEEEMEKAMEKPGLFEGDIKLFDGMNIENLFNKNQKKDTIAFRLRRWPGRVLYYKFHPSLSHKAKMAVLYAMLHITRRSCVKFAKRTTQKNYVYIIAGKGCYSSIGRRPFKKGQTLSIGRGCEYLGIAAHELLHALGFFHEHSRPDRDKYVRIHFKNIRKGKKHNFIKYLFFRANDLGAPYDLGSIMHYGRKAFSKNKKNTITPIDRTVKIGQKRALSPIDVWQLNKLYKCKGTSPAPREVVGCTFDNGWCDFRNQFGDDFNWFRKKGSTPSSGTGPDMDHTSNSPRTGYYFYTEASPPRKPGDVARLVTPLLVRKNGFGCIRFWYHMWGSGMGKLKVKVENVVLWEKKGNQGNSWKKAAIPFTLKRLYYRVTFESVVGSSFRSDVAIDDVWIKTGSAVYSSCQ